VGPKAKWGNVIKFRCTLNFLLLATLAVMDTFWDGYKRKEIMKVVLVETMRPAQVQKWYVKGLNAKDMIYDICLLDSQILILMAKSGHNE
jgi:hypothetical protein